MSQNKIIVAALYKFARIEDPGCFQSRLQNVCDAAGVFGTLLLASEGINGTVAGSRSGIDTVLAAIRTLPGCNDLEHKESHADVMPFHRMKVRIKKEIVTMGVPGIDPNRQVGEYVDPADWNDMISNPNVVVIDTRNDYEVEIGTFKGRGQSANDCVPRVSGLVSQTLHGCGQPNLCHVLHRRDPVRKGDVISQIGRNRRRVSSQGRHSEIPRDGSTGQKSVGGRVFRL